MTLWSWSVNHCGPAHAWYCHRWLGDTYIPMYKKKEGNLLSTKSSRQIQSHTFPHWITLLARCNFLCATRKGKKKKKASLWWGPRQCINNAHVTVFLAACWMLYQIHPGQEKKIVCNLASSQYLHITSCSEVSVSLWFTYFTTLVILDNNRYHKAGYHCKWKRQVVYSHFTWNKKLRS